MFKSGDRVRVINKEDVFFGMEGEYEEHDGSDEGNYPHWVIFSDRFGAPIHACFDAVELELISD